MVEFIKKASKSPRRRARGIRVVNNYYSNSLVSRYFKKPGRLA